MKTLIIIITSLLLAGLGWVFWRPLTAVVLIILAGILAKTLLELKFKGLPNLKPIVGIFFGAAWGISLALWVRCLAILSLTSSYGKLLLLVLGLFVADYPAFWGMRILKDAYEFLSAKVQEGYEISPDEAAERLDEAGYYFGTQELTKQFLAPFRLLSWGSYVMASIAVYLAGLMQ
jgi:hypothetical protein